MESTASPAAPADKVSIPQLFQRAAEHHQAGCLAQAETLYQEVLRLQPKHADALHLSGVLAGQFGNYARAVELINKALAANPKNSAYHGNLGLALQAQGRIDQAIASYRKAVTLGADHTVHNNLGNALQAQGKLDESVASYRRALALKPDFADAQTNLGNVYKALGKFEEAIACHRQALMAKPSFAAAYNNIALVLHAQGKFAEAVENYKQALSCNPDYAEAYNNLGQVLHDQRQFDAAITSFRHALALKPNFSDAFSNYLLSVQYDPMYSPLRLLAEHVEFAKKFEEPLREKWLEISSNVTQHKLRVGLVSGDFGEHPVGFFLEGILTHLNRSAIDIVLYSTHDRADKLARRFKESGFSWRSLAGLSDDDAYRCVRSDDIDILVDLSGHTANNRLLLFARKPAPLQVAWLGYWATTGLQAMDYILCDRYGIPADEIDQFVEKPWYLPDTRLCFTPPNETVAVDRLPALQTGQVTFGCFNNLSKMNDAVVTLWARVLQAVPSSRLFLKATQLGDVEVCAQTAMRFAAHGINAERLIFEGASSRAEYFAAYHRVDIALDPFPFTGATTSVEGLWMGVPLITRKGDRMVAHQGESILHNVGLSDWIAVDDERYVALAVANSTDLTQLAELRAQLRARLLASPLCDAPRFSRNLEAALQAMWQQHCQKINEHSSIA